MINRIEGRIVRENLQNMRTLFFDVPSVAYYEAKQMDLGKAVDLFVRVNSGGVVLNASDLMLAVASGAQNDIHRQVHEAVEWIKNEVRELPCLIDNDFFLSAGLLCTDSASISLGDPSNYADDVLDIIFRREWERIKTSVKNALNYVVDLGFSGGRVAGKNLILPIVYYFYGKSKNQNCDMTDYCRRVSQQAWRDRIFIRQYLLRAMLKGIFTSNTNETLLHIRSVIRETNFEYFPLDNLIGTETRQSLRIGEAEVDEILEMSGSDSRIVPLFKELIAQNTACSQESFQIDHIWAKAICRSRTRIRRIAPQLSDEAIETIMDRYNLLPNLQPLSATGNSDKGDREFDQWFVGTYGSNDTERATYMERNIIPMDTGDLYTLRRAISFWDERERLLRERIRTAFPSDFEAIVSRYGL